MQAGGIEDLELAVCLIKQYVHVIYRGVIHVRVLQESFIFANGNILLDGYLEVVWCQNVSHPGGNMPAIWYVRFRVDSDGIRPLYQFSFFIFSTMP